jgi:hypothetical protein
VFHAAPWRGVGVRHALFPGGTRLDALAFAGGVLPDATLRGMRMSRSHGTVLTVAGRDLSSEASVPGRTPPAGGGSPDVVLTRLQLISRRHLYRGDGIGLWPIVGPALRV